MQIIILHMNRFVISIFDAIFYQLLWQIEWRPRVDFPNEPLAASRTRNKRENETDNINNVKFWPFSYCGDLDQYRFALDINYKISITNLIATPQVPIQSL